MTEEIVGRSDALRIIDKFCDPGNSLIVVGDPGLGKTTLLQYASHQWTNRGGRVLAATAVEFEADLGFAGLRQLLAREAMPDLNGDRLAVAESLRNSLRRVAIDRPVLVLVDDLQWLDRSSAAVLTLLARRLTGTRIGFLGSTRPEAEGFFERARLDEYLLTPLDDSASAEMLAACHPDLSPAARRRVLELAAGNPLALAELRGDTVGAVTSLTHAATLSPAQAERARRLATAAYVGAHLGGGLARAEDTLREVRRLETFAGSLDMAVATSFVILNADGDVDTAHRVLAGALDAVTERSFQTREALLTLLYVCFFGGRRPLWTVFDAQAARLYSAEKAKNDVVSLMRYTHSDPANGQPIDARSDPVRTGREKVIAQMAARGLTNKEIG
jgi:DNA-binding NarL/FixJ family response regulator